MIQAAFQWKALSKYAVTTTVHTAGEEGMKSLFETDLWHPL